LQFKYVMLHSFRRRTRPSPALITRTPLDVYLLMTTGLKHRGLPSCWSKICRNFHCSVNAPPSSIRQ
jgi:hypothetical protein